VVVALPSFIGLGIIGAAFVIVFKRGNPIVFVFGSASRLLSGVFFPVAVMPGWLQDLAQLLPLTHFLHALRLNLLEARGLADLARPMGILMIFAVVLYPLSLVTFAFATRHAKRAGALATY
jgi:ABC-2 type transport system permease protein